MLERRDRADDAGGAGQLAGHDAARLDRRPERATPHLGAQRHEQRVARLRHAAGDARRRRD